MTSTDLENAQAASLCGRIKKNLRLIKRWAKSEGITCFRVYDKDIPDVPLCVDVWQLLPSWCATKEQARLLFAQDEAGELCRERMYAIVQLYHRQWRTADEDERWAVAMKGGVVRALGIDEDNVVVKIRRRQRAQGGVRPQYQREDASPVSGWMCERGLVFCVELALRIDTGLFLDTSPLRVMVQSLSLGKRVLNLFCHTASFSVCALEGGASYVESVDLSSTALSMARRNIEANGFGAGDHIKLIKADAVRYLEEAAAHKSTGVLFDIIILDPPTFSNSKGTGDLDIRRDWQHLVNLCLVLLSNDGTLFFSTNARRFKMESSLVQDAVVKDISEQTLPPSFRDKRVRRTWMIVKAKAASGERKT